MSVSGNLRMELGDYLSFSPSMLPKNFLNENVKNSVKPKFVLQSNRIKQEQSEQDSCSVVSDSIEENKKPDNQKKDKISGLSQEEVIKMFNIAQEASVRELSSLMDKNLSESDYMQNPFFEDNNE